jgi:hypothetical protein
VTCVSGIAIPISVPPGAEPDCLQPKRHKADAATPTKTAVKRFINPPILIKEKRVAKKRAFYNAITKYNIIHTKKPIFLAAGNEAVWSGTKKGRPKTAAPAKPSTDGNA